jgi:rubrerythrin
MNKQEFQSSQTIINVCRAFLLESQNGARCKFVSEKCNEQNYCYLGELFKTTSNRCFAQSKVFYDQIESNMKDAGIEIEFADVYPFRTANLAQDFLYTAQEAEIARDEIYPEYAEVAKQEGFKDIADKFEKMYQIKDYLYCTSNEIYKRMSNNKLYKSGHPVKWQCNNCGHAETKKQAWDKCPFCDFKQGHVIVKVEDEVEDHPEE